MPIGTRQSTPIPRSYIYDARLNGIRSPLAREAYLRAKLVADNLGRLPGDPATLAGTLYPACPPKASEMARVIQDWIRAGLVFRYGNGRLRFLEIADNGLTQRLVGNMTGRSEFPAPPEKMIRRWEKKAGLAWQPVKRAISDSQNCSDAVHTQSERVSLKGREGKRGEQGQEGSTEGDGNDPAGRPFRPPEKDLTSPRASDERPSNTEELFKMATGGRFDPERGLAGYDKRGSFINAVMATLENLGRPKTAAAVERFMTEVVDLCNEEQGFKVPSGWMKVLGDLRRELGVAG